MNDEYYCKSRMIADYLIKNGSILLRKENNKDGLVYVFVKDQELLDNIALWEQKRQKVLF